MSVQHNQDVPLLSANKLSLFSGLDRRTVERKLLDVTPARETKRERLYRLQDVLPILCRPTGSAESEARMLGLREREQQAKTDAAELAQLEREKKTCLRSAAIEFWADAIIAYRQTVERASFLTPIQKTKLLSEMAKLKTKGPEAETD